VTFALETETYPGFPAGMNLALPAQDLADTEAQYLQDVLIDLPALTRRRGPLQVSGTLPQLAAGNKLTGIFTTLDPAGNLRYAVIADSGSASTFYSVNAAGNAYVSVATLPHRTLTTPPGSPYSLVDAKPALKGGLLIGLAQQYDPAQQATSIYWNGGISADYTTGTAGFTAGSRTLTGAGTSWSTTATPGMWVFYRGAGAFANMLAGCIKSVDSNTQITLVDPSPVTAAGANYTLTSVRGLYPRVMTGRVTCATTAATVNGGDTAFKTQALDTGTWLLYRFRDWALIGTVSTVSSEISLTLTGNAAISMANEQYIAIRADGTWSTDARGAAYNPGWMSAQYAGRQFYLSSDTGVRSDSYKLVYTETDDAEAYNLGYAGTWLPVTNQSSDTQESARGIAATYNALLLFKDTETFALQGTDPSVFSLGKIADDGCLATGSIQTYDGGVIWAGRQGIHLYDGVQVQNLTLLKLGQVWKNSISTFDPTKYRMWSFIYRDHYHLHIENIAPTKAPQKGSVTLQPSRWTIVINLPTGALTLSTNLNIRGAIELPSQAQSKTLFIVNGQVNGDTADRGYVIDAATLFDSEGLDTVYCDFGSSAVGSAIGGPDFYLESRKFDAGDGMRLKKWKILAANYLAQGGALKIDTVLGLNDFGSTLTTTLPASVFTWDTLAATFRTWDALKVKFSNWNTVVNGVFLPKRIKFQKQSQYFSFRIYQSTSSMQRVKLGPFMLAWKMMRPGRV
jgi:hypothetical protein